MRKFLLTIIAIVMVLAVTLTGFVGCSSKLQKLSLDDFEVVDMNIGKEMPVWTNATPISADMSAYEMYSTALANYYNTDFVISQQYGTALTKTGLISTSQVIDVSKVRIGVGDASGLNKTNATYYADSISYSSVTSLYEKTIIKDGDIFYRNADTNYNSRLDTLKVKSWNKISSDFKDIQDYVNQKSNNPTMLWMYDTSEENVQEISQPKYDEATDTYRFSIIFDPINSTTEYIKTMKQQLSVNAGMTVNKIDFLQLRIRFVLWSNGMLRYAYITEAYSMRLGSVINGTVTLNTEVQFSYDKNEDGYSADGFEESFNNSSALYVKPYGDSAVEKLSSIIAMQN